MRQIVQAGVAMLVFKRDQSVLKLLLGKRKGSHGAGEYSVPGGRLEPSELPLLAAIRETDEETGLQLEKVTMFRGLPYVNGMAGGQAWLTLFFQATVGLDAVAETCEPDKCEGWAWYPVMELPQPLFGPFKTLASRMWAQAVPE